MFAEEGRSDEAQGLGPESMAAPRRWGCGGLGAGGQVPLGARPAAMMPRPTLRLWFQRSEHVTARAAVAVSQRHTGAWTRPRVSVWNAGALIRLLLRWVCVELSATGFGKVTWSMWTRGRR